MDGQENLFRYTFGVTENRKIEREFIIEISALIWNLEITNNAFKYLLFSYLRNGNNHIDGRVIDGARASKCSRDRRTRSLLFKSN